MNLEMNESLIPVAHFQKVWHEVIAIWAAVWTQTGLPFTPTEQAPHNVFGIPFLLKIADVSSGCRVAMM